MSNPIKYYLATYNFVAFVFWVLFLVSFIAAGFNIDGYPLVLLNIAQGLAVLEILHAILKWVKSPVLSTTAQIASRLLVVGLIDADVFRYITLESAVAYSPHISLYAGLIIVSFAWSITEIIRYSFYFLGLFNKQPRWLLWARYSFFIALYPLGVTGEWLIFLSPGIYFNYYTGLLIILLLAYAYYFPVLYKYMWKQRKAKL